jgi:flagellin
MIEVLETQGIADTTSGATESIKLRFSYDDGDTWNTQTVTFAEITDTTTSGFTLTDGVNSVTLATTAATNVNFNAGDKLLLGIKGVIAGTEETITITTPISNGAATPASSQTSRTYTFADSSLSGTDVSLSVVQLDAENGEWNVGEMTLSIEADGLTAGTAKFDVESGGVATRDTELYKIDRFYDDDGNFVLGDSGKYISMYTAEGNETKIFIDGMDTIGELSDKINDAMKNDLGLGTGISEVDDHLADFVNQSVEGTDEALQGTIVIRSSKMGESGKLFFSAEEDVLNALSLVTINDPGLDPMEVTVTDAHTGEFIGKDTVADNVLRNVIEGVDVELDPSLDAKVSWSETDKAFKFTSEAGTVKEYIHIVDNAKSFQIGANEGQTMESFVGEMTAHALGVDKILVVNQETAQHSITKLDEAIDRVSSERSRIGAVINRLDHTINNLNVQQENTIASESRIRDLDIAKEATEMTKNQILNLASTSMIVQANGMANGLMSLLR